MTSYRLRCVYEFNDGRGGTTFDAHNIEAESLERAVEECRGTCIDKPELRFLSAVLTGPNGEVAWSLQSAHKPKHAGYLN